MDKILKVPWEPDVDKKKPAPVGIAPDIEIGRYALRTFKITDEGLGSVVKKFTWKNGVAIATCMADKNCKSPPGDGCACGIYGTLDLPALVRQYEHESRKCVAVIAAEGTTVIGNTGLRTAAARIVAYWCRREATAGGARIESNGPLQLEVSRPLSLRKFFAEQCPDAQHFEAMEQMLAAYGLPALPSPNPEDTVPAHFNTQEWVDFMKTATPAGVEAVSRALGSVRRREPLWPNYNHWRSS